METAFILVVVALSSAAAAMLFMRGDRPHRRFTSAVGKALETVGIAGVFLFLNLGLGFCLALLARAVGVGFVSLYINDDVAIVILSVLQALVFQWWCEPENT